MAALIVSIALLESCGLWLPAAVAPWGDLRTRAWIAAYLIFGASMMVAAIGLSLQTILAAYLSIRLKLSY